MCLSEVINLVHDFLASVLSFLLPVVHYSYFVLFFFYSLEHSSVVPHSLDLYYYLLS